MLCENHTEEPELTNQLFEVNHTRTGNIQATGRDDDDDGDEGNQTQGC